MLGVVLADNVFALFVFWELTSVTSYLLIGFNHEAERSRRAALQALLVTGGGGLALLAGLILLGQMGGSWELSTLLSTAATLQVHPLYPAALLLLLAGAFTKSAQFPFHFWLPNAMEAPTPVSAYLHSCTMVKAGVYLLARLNPGLGGTDLWHYLLVGFGAVTMLAGALLALRQRDLKLVLAYTTVTGLGTLVMLIGIGTPAALQAAALFLLGHALYKGALFMAVGAIDHGTGTRDVTGLGALARHMPVTAGATLLAAVAMAGLPPLFNFIAKEFLYTAALSFSAAPALLAAAVLCANAVMVTTAGLVAVRPFFGPPHATPQKPHEVPLDLWLGPVVLAALGLLLGLFHGQASALLLGPTATSLAGAPLAVPTFLWHGLTIELALSVITVLFGLGLYRAWPGLNRSLDKGLERLGWGPDRGYDQALAALLRGAGWLTRRMQNGNLQWYLTVTVLAFALPSLVVQIGAGGLPVWPDWPTAPLLEWGLVGLLLAGALGALLINSRVGAIATLGVVGYAVALIFLVRSAPDLAFTQFMVETLIVVILALALMRLPLGSGPRRPVGRMIADGAVAIAAGTTTTLLLLAVVQGELDLRLSDYFAAESVPAGHGRNIVNVILVDFRALDTLGEITVVAAAGLAVVALLGARRRRGKP